MKFNVIQKRNPAQPDAAGKWYASHVNAGKLTIKDFANEIAGRSSLTRGDIENVLINILFFLCSLFVCVASAFAQNLSDNISYKNVTGNSPNKCFNCPDGDISAWGLFLGYIKRNDFDIKEEGFQSGVIFEPLFKYGFGLKLELSDEFMQYENDITKIIYKKNEGTIDPKTNPTKEYITYDKYKEGIFEKFHPYEDFPYYEEEENINVKFNKYTLRFSFALEYRLNFSKWISPYIYYGLGMGLDISEYFIYEYKNYNVYDYSYNPHYISHFFMYYK